MAVYLLERIAKAPHSDRMLVGEEAVGYDEAYAIVVVAPNARIARSIAATETRKDVWNVSRLAQIREVPARTVEPHVILVASTGA